MLRGYALSEQDKSLAITNFGKLKPIDECVSLINLGTQLSKEIKSSIEHINECDKNVREIRERSNTDFIWTNNIVGEHWTPLSAIKQCYREIRAKKRALQENLSRAVELKAESLTDDEIDSYLGVTKSIETLGNLVKTIKKNYDLPEVIPQQMWEADEARSNIIRAFKDGYEEAMGSGRGLSGTGYTRYAHKVGIGCMEFQHEIQTFIQKERPAPATFEEEYNWVMEMAEKYKDHPFKSRVLKKYASI